jgi:hypothetical protein
MNLPIALFLVFGFCFGLASYSNRHLFSEGPTRRRDKGEHDPLDGRLMWTLICTMLWPIMVLTGLNSWWILSRRRAVAARRLKD